MTDDAARARDRLAGQRLDAGVRRRPPRTRTRRFTTPAGAGPGDRAGVGGPQGRRRRRDALRRPPRDGRAARDRGARLGARRLPRRDDELRDDGRAAGGVGQLRFDPFAMLPFCGYNMADYFAHWLEIGETEGAAAAEDLLRQLVPQGRRRATSCGPGFGENSRVLKWVFARCAGHGRRRREAVRPGPAEGATRHDGPRHARRRPRRGAPRRPRRAARAAPADGGAPREVRRRPPATRSPRSSTRSRSGSPRRDGYGDQMVLATLSRISRQGQDRGSAQRPQRRLDVAAEQIEVAAFGIARVERRETRAAPTTSTLPGSSQ